MTISMKNMYDTIPRHIPVRDGIAEVVVGWTLGKEVEDGLDVRVDPLGR